MKIFVNILKVLLFLATGIIAVVFNVIGVIVEITTEYSQLGKIMGILIFWLIFTVICYIAPVFFAMFKKYFICGALTFCGMICLFILHEMLPGGPSYLYMPLLFITLIGILLAIFGNWDKIHGTIEKREKEKNKAAPSILGGTAKPGDARVSKNSAKKQTKAKK